MIYHCCIHYIVLKAELQLYLYFFLQLSKKKAQILFIFRFVSSDNLVIPPQIRMHKKSKNLRMAN